MSTTPQSRPEWQRLQAHAQQLSRTSLSTLFAEDTGRAAALTRRHEELLADFSKQRLTADTLAHLHRLAEACELNAHLDDVLSGQRINLSEQRAALHTALRAAPGDNWQVDGVDVMPEVLSERTHMQAFVAALHEGKLTGFAGQPIRHLVNLGVGGSDLGPRMAYHALRADRLDACDVHFVANLDSADLASLLLRLDPRETLFLIASKSFTTQETLANAHSARLWLTEAGCPAHHFGRHFAAITACPEKAMAWGIPAELLFRFGDWVGGRFSLWSPVGLPLAAAIGWPAFERLLAGARSMDRHLIDAPASENLPLTMALVGLWNTHFLGAESLAILPYSDSLRLLPVYLQQLEMESNGKGVDALGAPLAQAAAPIVWGVAGTIGQHAFHQLLHQGRRLIPCDFIAFARSNLPLPGHQEQLLANCLAQSAALMKGLSYEQALAEGLSAGLDDESARALATQRACPGNQPSTTLLFPVLDPYHLGQLIALYEHKVVLTALLLGLNPFDQWGVELGKTLARSLLPALTHEAAPGPDVDPSTRQLIKAIHKANTA